MAYKNTVEFIMKIVVTPRGFAKCAIENVEIIKQAGHTAYYNDTEKAYTKEEFYKKTIDADGIIVGVETVDKEFIDSHPKLKAVVKFGVGTDNIDVDYCNEKGIFVGKTVGSNSRSVAETVISYILADSKNLYESIGAVKAGEWTKLTGYEVENKTLGIVGFGNIGQKVAKMANGLGMNVLVYDPYLVSQNALKEYNVKEVAIEDILTKSDFISLHVPLTEQTKNLITLKELKKMKPTCALINTARGGIVNEQELFFALTNKIIRCAYFDVLTNEPPKENEKLLTLPNFYLTPHIASRSVEAEKNTASMATQIIINALKN